MAHEIEWSKAWLGREKCISRGESSVPRGAQCDVKCLYKWEFRPGNRPDNRPENVDISFQTESSFLPVCGAPQSFSLQWED